MSDGNLMAMIRFWEAYKNEKMGLKSAEAAQSLDAEFKEAK